MTILTDVGIAQAKLAPVVNPLPIGWINTSSAPSPVPSWANIDKLTSIMIRNLQAQIGYDFSNWNYTKIGNNEEVGCYQITAQTLEYYGLLAKRSCASYGKDAINYNFCWRSTVIRKNVNSYSNYTYKISGLSDFLNNQTIQDHLSYQIILDLYTALKTVNLITDADTADTAAGMIYVAWVLGVGETPTIKNPIGTGAWAWRYHGNGDGIRFFNAGRYAVTILSQ